jgi:hypothetical protein
MRAKSFPAREIAAARGNETTFIWQ